MSKHNNIKDSLKGFWKFIEPFLENFFLTLSKYQWWFIGATIIACLLLAFANLYYEKGLRLGDAVFISVLSLLGTSILSIVLVVVAILVMFLTMAIILYPIKKKSLKMLPSNEGGAANKNVSEEIATEREDSGKSQKLPRIDEERLGRYFLASFKKKGNVDQFRILIDMLETERTGSASTVGKVALLIFNSSIMSSAKPKSFSKWIDIFFESLGLPSPKDKNMNKYKIDMRNDKDARLKSKYYIFL